MATSSTLAPILRNGTYGTSSMALPHNHPINGNPPHGHQPPPGKPQQYLPPLQPQSDPRSSAYPPPPPDQRGGYYSNRRPPYRQESYSRHPYYTYYHEQPPTPGFSPPHGHPGYRHIPASFYGYRPSRHGSTPTPAQAARRQRASIACNYCRQKRIRCSDYNSHSSGKCQNCARQNQECIFQPTSSRMLFIPVSALPGGVPPGAQVFGAYGQPLAPGTVPARPPPHAAYQQSSALPPPGNYYAPVQSPTHSLSSCGETKTDNGSQLAGRRRRRTKEEQYGDYGLPHECARKSPQNPTSDSLPRAATTGSYAASAPRGRSPTGQKGSSGALTIGRQGQQCKGGKTSIMSITDLLNNSDETSDGPN